MQLIVQGGFPYTDSISKTFRTIWSFFPPNPFSQAISVLSDAVSTPEDHGVSWSERGQCILDDENCVITIVCNNFTFKCQHPKPFQLRSLRLAFPFYFLFYSSILALAFPFPSFQLCRLFNCYLVFLLPLTE